VNKKSEEIEKESTVDDLQTHSEETDSPQTHVVVMVANATAVTLFLAQQPSGLTPYSLTNYVV